jgi:signal transduction histidine kinase
MTQALSPEELREAAAYALVTQRCRASHLHELRGGLQALNSAVELLARAAKNPGENPALAEKAVALARRALQNHEQALIELVNQVAPQVETAGTVNVGDMLSDVLRFIRTDAANKSISFRLASATDVLLRAPAHKLRLLLLGLCSTLADGLQAGTVVDVSVSRMERIALIEFRPALPAESSASAPTSASAASPLYELLLDVARRWVSAGGGSLDVSFGADSPAVLRISHPTSATPSAG